MFRCRDKGSWYLYGHSHGNLPPYDNYKTMDIGIDSIFKLLGEYRPISFEETLFENKVDLADIDHYRSGKSKYREG